MLDEVSRSYEGPENAHTRFINLLGSQRIENDLRIAFRLGIEYAREAVINSPSSWKENQELALEWSACKENMIWILDKLLQ